MKQLTDEDVRAVGGIVHRDGNVFFTNVAMLNKAVELAARPERAPLSDAEITQLMNDWGVVTTKHCTDKGEPFQSVELSFDRLSALLHAAHGIKQGGQHD